MLITCEDCNSEFQLDDSLIKEDGVKVKCSKCGKIFMAHAPSSIEMSGEGETGMQGFEKEQAGAKDNGLDFSEMEAMLSDAEDSKLDIASDDNFNISDSGFGFDETNELDLSDMDQIFEDGELSEVLSSTDLESEEVDLELDAVHDTVPSLGSTKDESEELEELDLLEADEEPEEEVAPIEDIEELDFELDGEKDTSVPENEEETDFGIDGESLGLEMDIESGPAETVEELGLSDTDMEDMFDVDEKTSDETLKEFQEDTGFSFDLEKELDVDEISEDIEPEEIELEEDSEEVEELGLTDLEEMFTLEEDQEGEGVEIEEADELDLEMDEAFEVSTDSEDFEPDTKDMFDMESEAGDAAQAQEGSEEDLDEFEEFGLTDLEEMFNLEAEQKPEAPESVADDPDDVDFGEEEFDDGDSEELEFKLDEAIAVLDGSAEEEAGVEFEEYEELDLSELDEMFDKAEVIGAKKDVQKEELGELDFGLDTLPETGKDIIEPEGEADLGIADTSELDFSDIGEMLESESEEEDQEQELDLPDISGIKEDESGIDFGLETKTPEEDESGLDFRAQDRTLVEDEIETSGLAEAFEDNKDFDLSDDDLDLSEMEKMLQESDSLDEEVAPVETAKPVSPPPQPPKKEEKEELIKAQDELDFGLDEEDEQEDFFKADETQDIELEFGVGEEEDEEDQEEKEEPPPVKPEVKKAAKAEEDDIEATYDMGIQLDELRKKQAAAKMRGVKVEEETAPPVKTKIAKKGRPIPFEKKKKNTPALAALLIIILVAGVPIALTNMGIKIPYVSDFISGLDIKIPFADKIQQANIPFISDLVKSGEQDVQGISKIIILEPTINGYYVENASAGVVFVISGQVRNDYDQLRNFISVKGQIYSKGKANIETKTVFAGNTLSEQELSSFNSAVIDKKLKNKYGDKKSNFKLNKGKAIPFMIVFMKVPDGLEGYDVEVTGSTLFQAEGGKK